MVKCKNRELEHQVICPFCSEKLGENFDFDCNNETECYCEMCYNSFQVFRHTEYRYTSIGGEI